VIRPGDVHIFEVERVQGWAGFSIDDTALGGGSDDELDGFGSLPRLRSVAIEKVDGQLGINPEVHCPDGARPLVKVAKVYPGTKASECGLISVGDVLTAINGQTLACAAGENPLDTAMKVLGETRDGDELNLELDSDVLLAGWVQKKGEKGLLGSSASWQRRWFMLVWSEVNVAEREIRYYDGQDHANRKQKGAIDLTRATAVGQKEMGGSAGLTIDTPGRVWELLPEGRDAAVEWYRLLSQLLVRKRGLAVVASLSNAHLDEVSPIDSGTVVPGELSVRLTRKLGMSINKSAMRRALSLSPRPDCLHPAAF